jgi:subtilase family serine protease
MEVRLDGSSSPAGTANATQLGAKQTSELCADVEMPVGPHKLVAMVDPARALPEMNEANNGVEQTFTVAPAATPTPTAQADLTISAVKVNGRVPDGKDDCKDGNNKVAVVVKNIGTANAGAFDVRLLVDPVEKMLESTLKQPAQPSDLVEAVTGLEAGKEIEVRFDGVRLKKGQHVLVAYADPKGTVAESKDDNNELRVTPACKDDD